VTRPILRLITAAALALVLAGCPSGHTQVATEITDTAATLNGTGNPDGVRTDYWFQYGTTTAYGNETPHRDGGSGTEPQNVSERVTGLSPSTTYHFRLVAQPDGGHPLYGPDQSFTTLGARSNPVFAIYYLWWERNHWLYRLGPNYPYGEIPNPLPATLDSGGCSAVSNYSGNTLTDVSQGLAYDQSNPAVIERDVRQAAAAGIAGFSVNWSGAGSASQTTTTTAYNKRLQSVFEAVHKLNAEGIPFKLQLNYKTAGHPSITHIANDLEYFINRYGGDPALDHTFSSKPEMVWTGSRGYTDDEKTSISRAVRSRLYLIGDEKNTWDANSAANFDGNSWYWPGQNPYKNPQSFDQIQSVASAVRSTKNPDGSSKVWLAPFAPGYNPVLLYGGTTCVPRNDGETMRRLFQGNLASNPDGWLFISWNEIAEASHIVPLTRYDETYLDAIRNVIEAGQ
jgi:hypothetical protein